MNKSFKNCKFILRSWIDEDQLDFVGLANNPNPQALEIIKENLKYIIEYEDYNHDHFWGYLFRRDDAIELLREYFEFVDYGGLSFNPKCLEVLSDREDEINNIDFTWLSRNRNFLPILEKYVEVKDNHFKEYLRSNLAYYYDMTDMDLISKDKLNVINESSKNNIVISTLNEIDWDDLSRNSHAFNFLSQNPKHVDWKILSSKPWAINLIENYLDLVDWKELSKNENAIHILEANLSKIDFNNLSYNKNAIHIIEKNVEKINWSNLSHNENAIHLLEKNISKIDFSRLIYNKNALHIIKRYPEKLCINSWNYFSLDCKDMSILEDNIDRFDDRISANPFAMDFLEKHQHKVDYEMLSMNPSIFIDEYTQVCKDYFCRYVVEEMMAKIFHPDNLNKFEEWGY